MHSSTIALVAIAGFTLVSAAEYGRHAPSNSSQSAYSTISPSEPFPTAVETDGVNFEYPLSNGFPAAVQDLVSIEQVAGGTLPNATPSPLSSPNGVLGVADQTLAVLRLIAFNELSEVAFFTELLTNITNNVPGYDLGFGFDRDYILASLKAIQAQEQLHALDANGALATFDKKNITGPIQPCEYNFPVSNFQEAVNLANTFTDVVLGTLQDAATALGADGDIGLIRGIAAVIGQEGQQDGFFRFLQDRTPSAQPFLTASAGPFAFSALNQMFVVPGSCPQDINSFGLPPVLGSLAVQNSPLSPGDQILAFEAVESPSYQVSNFSALQVVYINGQNLPVVEPVTNVRSLSDGTWRFEAFFPQATDIMHGLTIAALTPSTVTFNSTSTVDDVANAALFGPALIEILR
ncbi:hypothetical protein MBLNU457_g0976t1 [Dothideomycetes sp. NU457]